MTFHYLKEIIQNKIEDGKIIYLANDMKKTIFKGHEEGLSPKESLHKTIDILKESMLSNQTLVIPMFNWDFCRGKGYDARKTKSKVGVLGNILLEREDFLRTEHPLYSFFVYGKEAKNLEALRNIDAWDENSPFQYLYEKEAIQLNLDTPLEENFTFVHYVEKKMDSPYRYTKEFKGSYKTWEGEESIRTYTMFVRDLPYRNHLHRLKEEGEKKGQIEIMKEGLTTLEILKVKNLCDFLEKDFYETNGAFSLQYYKE